MIDDDKYERRDRRIVGAMVALAAGMIVLCVLLVLHVFKP